MIKIFPVYATHQQADSDLGYSELFGKINLPPVPAFIKALNLDCLSFCKFASPITFTKNLSVFLNAILVVFQGITKKQMVRSYARRVIAPMTNIFTVRNRPIVDEPRESMAHPVGTVRVYPTVGMNWTSPNPAFVGFSDLLPESYLRRFPSMVSAFSTAKVIKPLKHLVAFCEELILAHRAHAFNFGRKCFVHFVGCIVGNRLLCARRIVEYYK
jgi:hypothetical protein